LTIELMTGPLELALTVKRPTAVTLPPSVLVTVTSCGPGGEPAEIVRLTVIRVPLALVLTIATAMPLPKPGATPPMEKLVPLIWTLFTVVPCVPLVAESEVMVGSGPVTVKMPAPVPCWLGEEAVLVTVTSRAVFGAPPAMLMLTLIAVGLRKVVELMEMPVGALNATVGPGWKFWPLMITSRLFAPCTPLAGVQEVTIGAGAWSMVIAPETNCPSWLVTVSE